MDEEAVKRNVSQRSHPSQLSNTQQSPLKSSLNLIESPQVMGKRMRSDGSHLVGVPIDSPKSQMRPYTGPSHSGEDEIQSTLPPDYDYCTQVIDEYLPPLQTQWGRLVCCNNQYENLDLGEDTLEIMFGRHPDCDSRTRFASDNRTISARHCKVTRVDAGSRYAAQLTDLSTNGTFVNGVKVGKGRSIVLNDRDMISLGPPPKDKLNINNSVVQYMFEEPHARLDPTTPVGKRAKSTEKVARTPPSVSVLYSVPLAFTDTTGVLQSMDVLDYADERDLLCASMREAKRDIPLRFAFATTERLRALLTLGTRALHYSGHGNESYLSFEDGRAGVHLIPVGTLRELFAAGGTQGVEFVFVSACSSRPAGEAFVKAGVPHVIAVAANTQLADVAARVFTRDFYLALAVGKTVRESFDIARNAVRAAPIVGAEEEANNFILLPEDSAHDVKIFDDALPVAEWSMPVFTAPSSLPAIPEDFIGRNVDMFEVIRKVLAQRLVSVTGPHGIGKTALCVAVAHYVSERGCFRDGVILVKLHSVTMAMGVCAAMTAAIQAYQNLFPGVGGPTPAHLSSSHSSSPRAVEELCSLLRTRRALIILDRCDSLFADTHKASTFVSLLSQLSSAAPNVSFLITATCSISGLLLGAEEAEWADVSTQPSSEVKNHETAALYKLLSTVDEKVHELKPLSAFDSARLFARRSPRKLTAEEVGVSRGPPLLQTLSRHPTIAMLEGIPRRILAAAAQLHKCKFQQIPQFMNDLKSAAAPHG